MKTLRLHWLLGFCAVLFSTAPPLVAQLQLAVAFEQLGQYSGVNIVYAQSAVAGKTTLCSPQNSVQRGLRCMLSGTDLSSRQISPSQWVIVPNVFSLPVESRIVETTPPPPPNPITYQVRGRIRDAETGKPLVQATLYLPDLQRGCTTNEKGVFNLQNLPKGIFKADVRLLGYATESIWLDTEKSAYLIRLKQIEIPIEELEVKDLRIADSDIGAFQLPLSDLAQQLRLLSDADMFDLLAETSGAQLTGELGGDLIVRAGEADQSLYLLDGIPFYQPGGRNIRFSPFQADLIQYVKFYKGASPAELGGKLAAVVQAELKDGRSEHIQHTFFAGNTQARFQSEIPIGKKLGLLVSGRQSLVSKFQAPQSFFNSQYRFDFSDTQFKLTFLPQIGHRLEAFSYFSRDRFNYTTNSVESSELNPILIPEGFQASSYESQRQNKTQLLGLRYRWVVNPKQSFFLQAYQSGYRYVENNQQQIQNLAGTTFYLSDNGEFSPLTEANPEEHLTKLTVKGIRLNYEYYPDAKTRFSTGFEGSVHQFKTSHPLTGNAIPSTNLPFDVGFNEPIGEYTFFVGVSQKLSEQVSLQLGLRSGSFKQNLYATPSGSFQFNAAKGWTFRGGLGKQMQHIHRIYDRFGLIQDPQTQQLKRIGMLISTPSSAYLANIAAEKELGKHSELSAEFYYRVFEQVPISTRPYRHREGWERSWLDNWLNPTLYVLGKSYAKGLELKYKAQSRLGNLTTFYNHTAAHYQLPQNQTLPARYDAPNQFGVDYTYAYQRFLMGFAGEWRSGYPVDTGSRLSPYKRIDVMSSYQFHIGRSVHEISGRIFNLFNWNNSLDQVLPNGARIPEVLQGKKRLFFLHLKTKF